MMKRNFLLLTASMLLLAACSSGNGSNTKDSSEAPSDVQETKIMERDSNAAGGQVTELSEYQIFKAVGQEPGWSLTLDTLGSFSFKSYDGMEMNTPAVKGVTTGNITTYRASVEMGEMITTITEEKCADIMSGKEFPFSVSVSIKRGVDKDFKTYKGCGTFMN